MIILYNNIIINKDILLNRIVVNNHTPYNPPFFLGALHQLQRGELCG
jgi:hypothetical protein